MSRSENKLHTIIKCCKVKQSEPNSYTEKDYFMRKTAQYFFLLLMTSFCGLSAEDKSKMLQDLDIIKSTFETKYAPYEWKKSYLGWSLEEEITQAKIKILSLNSLTVKDYQRILHSFFISTCDYHVSDVYYSTEVALLPFDVKSANGKYFISKVDKRVLNLMKQFGDFEGDALPQIGDEILQFDSQPIANIIEDLKFRELGNPTSKTAQVLAEIILTKRMGRMGHQVPQGTIQLLLKKPQGTTSNVTISWVYQPEKITDRTYRNAMSAFGKIAKKNSYENDELKLSKPFKIEPKIMINTLADTLQKDNSDLFNKILVQMHPEIKELEITEELDEEITAPVSREGISFGKTIWRETVRTPFKAHIYKLPGSKKRIGYIRIETYSPSEDYDAVSQLVIRLAQSIRYFERNTDALLIDQVDNPGGYSLYALAIASMVTNRPLTLPLDRETITQAEIAQAFGMRDEFGQIISQIPDILPVYDQSTLAVGYPVNKEFIQNKIDQSTYLIDQWNQGNSLTTGYPMDGIKSLLPHPLASYSKPVMVLVNSNDFSGGDFFPAILQDNKRAVIFGEQTAGAGGYVKPHSYPNSFGLQKFSYTGSIASRMNGSVLENLGVTPDIPYSLTENDLLKGYPDYIKAVNSSLKKIIVTGDSDPELP